MAKYEKVIFNNLICVGGAPVQEGDSVTVVLHCGTTATLVVVSVIAEGRGFVYDRAAGTNNDLVVLRGDIYCVTPAHHCPTCAEIADDSPSPSPSPSPV